MSGTKRSTKVSFGKDDYYDMGRPSSSKRAKMEQPSKAARRQESTDFEIDHEISLEPAKQRRGAVAKDVYASDDEEVGGGAFSSDSDNGGDSDDDEAKTTKKTDDDEDFDMFSSTVGDDDDDDDAGAGKSGGKNKGKKKRLGLDDIEGQELGSRDQESDEEEEEDGTNKTSKGNKLTAFNMQQEMEEGSFDAQGNYIRNSKDPEAFHDQWMEGISKKDMAKAKQARFVRDQAEKVKEATRQSSLPQTQADVYRMLVEYLLPGESVKDALTELGKGAQGKIPLWKQKLLAKKNKNKKPAKDQSPVLDEQKAADRQRKVEDVTGLADQLMALGHFTVYEDTFESMVRYLRSKMEVDEYWVPQSSQRK